MKKRTAKILGWGCLTLLVLGILGFAALNVMMAQGFSAPFLYVSRSPVDSQTHEAWFLMEGFVDRGWVLCVKPSGVRKAFRVASLDFDGEFSFCGAEWSHDGQVIAATIRLPTNEARAIAYDFAQGAKLVPDWSNRSHFESNVLAVVREHGGFSGNFIPEAHMRESGKEIWVWQTPK